MVFFHYSRLTPKEIKAQNTTSKTRESWIERFSEVRDQFWTFISVDLDQGHFTEQLSSFDWKCSLLLICSTPCSKKYQGACSGRCPLQLWKSVFKKLKHQAMSLRPPCPSFLTQIFCPITQNRCIPKYAFLLQILFRLGSSCVYIKARINTTHYCARHPLLSL